MLKNCVFRADDPPVDPRSRQESHQDHGADICRSNYRIGSSHGRGQLAYGSQRIRACLASCRWQRPSQDSPELPRQGLRRR